MISIAYSELLKKYDEILISTSRGFDTNHEFLESWVPNPDFNQSISDLFNSAIDYNLKELELIFSEKEIKILNLDNLKKKFINLGIFDLKDNKLTFFYKKND
tara:strand:+ start:49 stop:354 length:306 start_codon:yes stop_codon:yes gene_type:complete